MSCVPFTPEMTALAALHAYPIPDDELASGWEDAPTHGEHDSCVVCSQLDEVRESDG